MSTCAKILANLGIDCPPGMGEIVRVLVMAKTKADGTANTILKTALADLASLQAKFDINAWEDNALEKVMPTPRFYLFDPEQSDQVTQDEGGILNKLREGDYNLIATFSNIGPKQVGQLKELEVADIVLIPIDDKAQAWGIDRDTEVGGVDILNTLMQNFNPVGAATGPQAAVIFRLEDPKQMNKLVPIAIVGGSAKNNRDFYSLIDADAAVSAPSITDIVLTVKTVDPVTGALVDPVTGLVIADINVFDDAAPTVPIVPTDVVEDSPGVYTVTVAGVASNSYKAKIKKSRYDTSVAEYTIP